MEYVEYVEPVGLTGIFLYDVEGQIVGNEPVAPGYFLLTVALDEPIGEVLPGQFVMLRLPGNEVFLRRPFSVYNYREQEQEFDIMYKVVGRGTQVLSNAFEWDRVKVLGPLGNGFSVRHEKKHLLLAGGIGIAGIHMLALQLGPQVPLLFGCGSEGECALANDLALPPAQVCTLDGTYGFHGSVIDLLAGRIRDEGCDSLQIFACGPMGMIRALHGLLNKERPMCHVLMEERMACGMGLCFGCVTKTVDEKEPYKRVCKEGAVFDLWQLSL
jgi:dihydroorotate dehydrogenase electron transfer subunit